MYIIELSAPCSMQTDNHTYSDLYILQTIKVDIDILSYYYNCKCMQIIAFEGG